MSEEDRRAEMLELRDMLNNIARLSDEISVLRATHSIDAPKVREMENELAAVNARANELRELIARHDDTPVPR